MAPHGLDTEGLTNDEIQALERFGEWCGCHEDRSGVISLVEASEQDAMRWWIEDRCPNGLLLFSDGDASNFAGVYRDGPLRGMVFFLTHDEENLAPRFASVQSFTEAVMSDAPDVRDLGMLAVAEPPLGDFPPAVATPELTELSLTMFRAGEWDDPEADDDAQFQSYLSALALVPSGAVPIELLDEVARALLSSRNMYLWQAPSAPALLTRMNYRGHGSRIASVLDEHRESLRWDVVIDPIRELLREAA